MTLTRHVVKTNIESMSEKTIAALYVVKGGVYWDLAGVDPWDEPRDARRYAGPYPVIAHPPCQRWGNYATGGPTATPGKFKVGDDSGCFKAALASVRAWGGVLEHPEASKAWRAHGLLLPPFCGGWVVADELGGWTCCVDQGFYGHVAQKSTWLYAVGCELPSLRWGRAKDKIWIGSGFNKKGAYQAAKLRSIDAPTPENAAELRLAKAAYARQVKTGICQNLSKKQRTATPLPFRDLLLSISRTAYDR